MRMISGRFGVFPYSSIPKRKSFEPSISESAPLAASRPSDAAICHGGMTAPETADALMRSIMLVAAVGGNMENAIDVAEFGVARNTGMTQNGQTFRIVR